MKFSRIYFCAVFLVFRSNSILFFCIYSVLCVFCEIKNFTNIFLFNGKFPNFRLIAKKNKVSTSFQFNEKNFCFKTIKYFFWWEKHRKMKISSSFYLHKIQIFHEFFIFKNFLIFHENHKINLHINWIWIVLHSILMKNSQLLSWIHFMNF